MRWFAAGWALVCLASGMMACTEDDGGDADSGAAPVVDATVDGSIEVDTGPVEDAAPRPDMAPVEVDMGDDRCVTACERLGRCAIEQCEGIGGDDAAAVEAACGALCGETPMLANVINGAGDCGTVVEFGRDRLPALLGEACDDGGDEPDPLPTDIPCPFPCEAGEQCLGGYCVRDDGTCETDYHCRPDREVCDEGTCVVAQLAECRESTACGEELECRIYDPSPLASGFCMLPCGADAECPLNQSCQAQLGQVCYFEFCGGQTNNGTLYQDCTIGVDFAGTCYPLAQGSAAQGQPGYCLEAGTAEVGAPCDNVAPERNEADAALRCVPGALCFGDPDNPLDPADENDERGQCTQLCDPREESPCPEGTYCLDYSNPDDPATAFDETQYIGVCYPSDCSVIDAEACDEGEECRVLAATTDRGNCIADTGEAALGEACEGIDDCAGNAICGGNNRDESVCVALCDPAADGAECGEEQICFQQDETWQIGFCIYGPPEPPAPDGGMPAPDGGINPDAGPEPDQGVEPDAGAM